MKYYTIPHIDDISKSDLKHGRIFDRLKFVIKVIINPPIISLSSELPKMVRTFLIESLMFALSFNSAFICVLYKFILSNNNLCIV